MKVVVRRKRRRRRRRKTIRKSSQGAESKWKELDDGIRATEVNREM